MHNFSIVLLTTDKRDKYDYIIFANKISKIDLRDTVSHY